MSAPPFAAPEGLYFDEVSKLRVIEPEKQQETQQLREECKEFVDRLGKFHEVVNSLISQYTTLSKSVDHEKMQAIGSRNVLQSMSKKREAEALQLQALLAEKTAHLERLNVQYQSLQKVLEEQEQFIEEFILQK